MIDCVLRSVVVELDKMLFKVISSVGDSIHLILAYWCFALYVARALHLYISHH